MEEALEEFFAMRIIARIHSDFPSKFGIPRQSGLVDTLQASVILEPAFRNPDALRGLSGFSHIWLIWVFHQAVKKQIHGKQSNGRQSDNKQGNNGKQGNDRQANGKQENSAWSPTVRPPRLGGNQRVGVFASRSPFRPNPIGLSCVRLEGIEEHTPDGPILRIRGADLMDGTPILDIKPYLPYADCIPNAAAGFAPAPSGERLEVRIPPDLLERVPADRRAALRGVLAQDPRPRYQNDPARVYGFGFAGVEIKFTVSGNCLTVIEIT